MQKLLCDVVGSIVIMGVGGEGEMNIERVWSNRRKGEPWGWNSGTLWLESEKAMAPHFSPLAWKSHGRSRLVGCSPWGHLESDMTEWLPFHFSLSCIGEGNGNPLQCSCLENPRDGGAWWAAIYGVAQSWTRLKWLSSSSMVRMKVSIAVFILDFTQIEWDITELVLKCRHD